MEVCTFDIDVYYFDILFVKTRHIQAEIFLWLEYFDDQQCKTLLDVAIATNFQI